MKRYLIIISIGLLGCAALAFFYFRSQSDFNQDHQQNMRQFASIHQSDTAIDKEVLSLQHFVTQDGDVLNEPINTIKNFCNLTVMQYFLNSRSVAYDLKFESFCQLENLKFENIKAFQKINTDYRNSVFFLQEKLRHLGNEPVKEFVKTALIYALATDSDLQEKLKAELSQVKIRGTDPKILENVNIILESCPKLDELIGQILNTKTQSLVNEMRDLYFEDYTKDQALASRYTIFLFAASLILVIFVIYNSFVLVGYSKQLRIANDNLEERVKLRTQELTESKNKILEHQQSLINVSKMSALGEMAAGVAHEINTPLATIQMRTTQMIELLQEQENVDKEFFIKALEKVDLTTLRIAKIIKGLLLFSRDGKVDEKEMASVHKIVHETFDLCKERFKNSDIALEFISGEDALLFCHPTAISQVLLNFLNNSFDAIFGLKEKWIRVQLDLLEDSLIISITDSGPGIPFEIQEKILQPFFTTKEIGKGTGLGLSISKGIIDSHGGTVGIDNTCAHTRFVLTFPRI